MVLKLILLWSINFLFFIFLISTKKKIKILPIVFLTFFVTFFSLFTPNGKILFSIYSFNFTLGALFDGLLKSGIFIMIQLVSKIIMSFNINFPGKIGKFVTEVFLIYEKLTFSEKSKLKDSKKEKKSIREKIDFDNLISSIDKKLLSIQNL